MSAERSQKTTASAQETPRILQNNNIQKLSEIILRGGPEVQDHGLFTELNDDLAQDFARGLVTREEIEGWVRSFGKDYLTGSLQGRVMLKPHGYAGDFEIIDRIYRGHVSEDPRWAKLDRYFQAQPATQAVRNRKSHFIRVVEQMMSQKHVDGMDILDLGAGPARDVLELLLKHDHPELRVVCLDHDPNAIGYAQKVCAPVMGRVRFLHGNILRFHPTQSCDLIWCAGVFDYLNDGIFRRLVKRLSRHVRPGGQLVVGNFSPQNPNKNWMELQGNWYLNHRSTEQLASIAGAAGARPEDITMTSETLGINLFMHVGRRAHKGDERP